MTGVFVLGTRRAGVSGNICACISIACESIALCSWSCLPGSRWVCPGKRQQSSGWQGGDTGLSAPRETFSRPPHPKLSPSRAARHRVGMFLCRSSALGLVTSPSENVSFLRALCLQTSPTAGSNEARGFLCAENVIRANRFSKITILQLLNRRCGNSGFVSSPRAGYYRARSLLYCAEIPRSYSNI